MTIIDMDVYRWLLLQIGGPAAPYLKSLDEETLTFYTRWMRTDNLIEGEILKGFAGNRRSLLQLTEKGAQYAELLRDSTRWGYVKAMMRRHHLPFEMEVVKRLSAEFDEQ